MSEKFYKGKNPDRKMEFTKFDVSKKEHKMFIVGSIIGLIIPIIGIIMCLKGSTSSRAIYDKTGYIANTTATVFLVVYAFAVYLILGI